MSFDVFFCKPENSPKAPSKNLIKYFSERTHFELNDGQAFYENEETGVYFNFELLIEDSDEFKELCGDISIPGFQICPVSFNINCFRPHIFGLEAEIEILSFMEHFDLFALDPHIEDGMKPLKYDNGDFFESWSIGNKHSYQFMSTQDGLFDDKGFLPTTVLTRCWKWNYEAENLRKQYSEQLIVHRIFCISLDNKIVTCMAWLNEIYKDAFYWYPSDYDVQIKVMHTGKNSPCISKETFTLSQYDSDSLKGNIPRIVNAYMDAKLGIPFHFQYVSPALKKKDAS